MILLVLRHLLWLQISFLQAAVFPLWWNHNSAHFVLSSSRRESAHRDAESSWVWGCFVRKATINRVKALQFLYYLLLSNEEKTYLLLSDALTLIYNFRSFLNRANTKRVKFHEQNPDISIGIWDFHVREKHFLMQLSYRLFMQICPFLEQNAACFENDFCLSRGSFLLLKFC